MNATADLQERFCRALSEGKTVAGATPPTAVQAEYSSDGRNRDDAGGKAVGRKEAEYA